MEEEVDRRGKKREEERFLNLEVVRQSRDMQFVTYKILYKPSFSAFLDYRGELNYNHIDPVHRGHVRMDPEFMFEADKISQVVHYRMFPLVLKYALYELREVTDHSTVTFSFYVNVKFLLEPGLSVHDFWQSFKASWFASHANRYYPFYFVHLNTTESEVLGNCIRLTCTLWGRHRLIIFFGK